MAGGSHGLVLNKEGALYSFSGGAYGQLGHSRVGEEHSPKMVDALHRVRISAASASVDHSLTGAEDGSVFSWGHSGLGQLGLGKVDEDEDLPHKGEALVGLKVCTVAAGVDGSSAMTGAGELYTWGAGHLGRLGHNGTADQPAPKRVKALQNEWMVAVSRQVPYHCGHAQSGAEGLSLREAANSEDEEDDVVLFITLPCHYQKLVCVPRIATQGLSFSFSCRGDWRGCGASAAPKPRAHSVAVEATE